MAEALNPKPETKLAASPEAEPLRRRAAGHLGFGALRRPSGGLRLSRVGLAYLLLALAIGGAAAGIVLALTGGGSSSAKATATSSAWSTWQPAATNRVTTLIDIARHVAPEYRLKGGQQLTAVIPKPAVVTTTDAEYPISAVIIHSGFPLDQPKDLSVGLIRRGAMYIMRGGGGGGALPGTPSVARGDLVRREARELALYTFTYIPSVDSVLVFIPPLGTVQRVVILQRGDVAPLLERPLARSLKPASRITAADLTRHERTLIDDVTRYRFFVVKDTSQLPDGTVSLTLTPPTS